MSGCDSLSERAAGIGLRLSPRSRSRFSANPRNWSYPRGLKSCRIMLIQYSKPPNQRLKLTGAAILVIRASTSLQAAPAA
jgi:hypothetical protein